MSKQIVIDNYIISDNPIVIYSILIFIIIWVFLGFMAFIFSLWCFKYDSTLVEKILGILLAIFTGPLYFIYYKFNKNYCSKNDIAYISPNIKNTIKQNTLSQNTMSQNTPRQNTLRQNTPRQNTPRQNTPRQNTPKPFNNVRFNMTNNLSNTSSINKKLNNTMPNGILKNN